MTTLFWILLFMVFYTYVGYGMLIYALVWIKEHFFARHSPVALEPTPISDNKSVTLLIAAYNEQDVVQAKMENCRALIQPPGGMKTVWVCDGSDDKTVELLKSYPEVQVLFQSERRGKSAAIDRAISFVDTDIVVFTDANTMLNAEAVVRMTELFSNPKVGCVAGEKRVAVDWKQGATSGEGIYWRYESKIKELDYRFHSAVGAAGELFAIRRNLYIPLPSDTLLDDFVMSMKIAQRGYIIAYCKQAWALESGSDSLHSESKRKVRIAAGGLQSIARLLPLLNPLKYPALSFTYISHRVLRWSVTPLAMLMLLPLNMVIVMAGSPLIYILILALQTLFYMMALAGYLGRNNKNSNKYALIIYYFVFMNINALRAIPYLIKHRGNGTWEKAKRAQNLS